MKFNIITNLNIQNNYQQKLFFHSKIHNNSQKNGPFFSI